MTFSVFNLTHCVYTRLHDIGLPPTLRKKLTYVLNLTFSVSRFEVIAFQIIDIEISLNRMSITTHYRINISVRTFVNNLANSNRCTNLDAKIRSGTRYGVISLGPRHTIRPWRPTRSSDSWHQLIGQRCQRQCRSRVGTGATRPVLPSLSVKNFGGQNNVKMTADIVVALSLTYNTQWCKALLDWEKLLTVVVWHYARDRVYI